MIGDILLEIAKPALAALGVLLLGIIVKWFKKHNKNYKETPEEKSDRELQEFLIFKYKIYKALQVAFPYLVIKFKGKIDKGQENEIDIYIPELDMGFEILHKKYSAKFKDYYIDTDDHYNLNRKGGSVHRYANQVNGSSGSFKYYVAGMTDSEMEDNGFKRDNAYIMCNPQSGNRYDKSILLGIINQIRNSLLNNEQKKSAKELIQNNFSSIMQCIESDLSINEMRNIKHYDAISLYEK